MTRTADTLWTDLRAVKDPEVPVLDIVEMGIVRAVAQEGEAIRVDITPTYSGCPAMHAIECAIVETLAARGYPDVTVRIVFGEPWTTDWMTDEARQKLKAYGIAPPERTGDDDWMPFSQHPRAVPCPFCDSDQTRLTSPFGATACKALHYCDHCQQPFEHFKCI